MTGHDARHERILGAILDGSLDRDDPRALELVGECRRCRDRLAELETIAASLADTGRFERDVLAEIATIDDAPGLEHVDNVIRGAARQHQDAPERPDPDASRPTANRRRLPAVLAIVAAAAVILVAVTLLTDPRGTDEPFDPGANQHELGPGSWPCRLLAPDETVAPGAFSPFRFEASRNPGEYFEVRVYALPVDGGDGKGERVATSHELEDTSWSPTNDDTREWPDEVVWEVCVMRPGNETRACSGTARASRSN